MTLFRRHGAARFAGAVTAATLGVLALSGTTAPRLADAQTLNGRPGVEYYPSWMLDADPRVSGGGQDYRIWDDKRFDRRDEEFLEFQRRQRQELGTGYRDSPEYKQDLQQFDEQRADRKATGSFDSAPVQERGTAAPR